MAAIATAPSAHAHAALHPRRRRHSKQHRIESILQRLGEEWQGGPTALARIAAEQLGEAVTKQEARLVLVQSKLPPQAPLPQPPEVEQFRQLLAGTWRHPDQIVYVTAIKFDSNARLRRRSSVDFTPFPELDGIEAETLASLDPQAALESTPDVVEVVGAVAVLDPRDPSHALGLLTCSVSIEPLTTEAVCAWVERDLVPLLGAYPGRRSLVVFDDISILRGRQWHARLSSAMAQRGAHCMVRPPLCPEFEPLERIWDQVLVSLHQHSSGPMSVRRGERLFRLKDTTAAFNAARLPYCTVEEVMGAITKS